MKRSEILKIANEITNGNREEHYGKPEDNFQRIANLWSSYLGKQVTPTDVAALMILMKVARTQNDPFHIDSWVDICGYAACAGEINSIESEIAKDEVES